MRQLAIALTLGLLAAGSTGMLGSQQALAAKGSKAKVGSKKVSPTKLPASGGTVFVSVAVTKKGSPITEVRAQGQVPGGAGGPIVTLARSGSKYTGSVTVPPNYQTFNVKGSIRLFISSADGIEDRPVGSVSLLASDGTFPPPPPPR